MGHFCCYTCTISLLVILCVPSLIQDVKGSKVRTCQDGWRRHGSSCYFFDNTPGNIYDAQNGCNSRGGYVAEIDNGAENAFLQQMIKDLPRWEYYIGLNDVKQEGTYSWFGSNRLLSQTGYSNWDDNEPNNVNDEEDCAVIRRINGFWNDVSCNRTGLHGYICEITDDVRTTSDDPFTDVVCGLRPMEKTRKKTGITKRELFRIVGGSEAPKGFYPWQVGVRVPDGRTGGNRHSCGGIILSEYWILSAAHCFTTWPKENVTVRVGDHDNTQEDDYEQEFKLEHLIKHSQYNETPHDYDIALLKIKPKNGRGIKFGDHVQPACLPKQTTSYVDGQQCHVSGWGKMTSGGSSPDKLQSAIVRIISNETCHRLYKNYTITPRMVCAGYQQGGIDTCQGDSGGPLVCDINNRYTVMGATSWGKGCGKEDKPGVYARVTEFLPWIKLYTARLSRFKTGLDVVLMMDTSASIGEKSLQTAKEFMKMLVDVFGVSDRADGGKGTRFALLTFSSDAKIVFNLNDPTARSKEAVKSKIDGIKTSGGGTDFWRAFDALLHIYLREIRDSARYMYMSPNTAIFLITDGQETSTLGASRTQDITYLTDSLNKEINFEIFTIGVGINIDRVFLAKIASKPKKEHVFLTNQFKDLNTMVNIISTRDYGQCGISGKTENNQGSENAARGAWPWLGWLTAVSEHSKPKTCGGALLCDRWFMTAASCVSNVVSGSVVPNEPSEVNIFLSDHHLTDQNDNDIVYAVVENIHIHDNYTGDVIGDLGVRLNDIALIDLGENKAMRPTLGEYLRPICFPIKNTRVQSDAEFKAMLSFPGYYRGYTAGWGHAPDNADHLFTKFPFNELKQNKRLLQRTHDCKRRYPDLDTDRFFCVDDYYKESDTCVGDIGGPYMVQMTSEQYVSVGLALNTRGCDQNNRFSIFLNLIHPDVSTWAESILDGCNRVEEIL